MIRAVVTDIEGTTSSIAFVKDVLFPYAYKAIPDFLRAHHNDPEIATLIEQARQEASQPDANLEATIQILLQWIKADKKITPLKAIQGHVWRHGYEQSHFQAHLYKDAYEKLKQWHAQGLPLYVYSSGSIQAQKLFFAHTEYGDIAPWFSGHFDTTTGPKADTASYRTIAEQISNPPGEILFLSDVTAELEAAAQAGLQTCWIVRDSQQKRGNIGHLTAKDFYSLPV